MLFVNGCALNIKIKNNKKNGWVVSVRLLINKL